jgi:DNA (cytosine-5)-methyltransferase 1
MGDPTTDNYVVTGGFFDQSTGCLNANGKAAGSVTQQDAETNVLIVETVRSHPRPGSNSVGNLAITHYLRADGFDASEDGTGRGTPLVPVGFMPARTLAKDGEVDSRYAPRDVCDAIHTNSGSGNKAPLVAFNLRGRDGGSLPEPAPDNQASLRSASGGSSRSYVAQTLSADMYISGGAVAGNNNQGVRNCLIQTMAVRRLTPRECERLQGFPDDYTRISDKTADGPRYRALGNSMAVPCMRWIGRRIQLIDLFS